jgi:tRNA threonylcarbamoyladenosine biosynthesis protein TsaB
LPTFALDTATPSPSLALVRGDVPVAELWLGASPGGGGGRRVLEAAHHLFEAAGTGVRDLERIVVGVGPGGFTGLRIGVATALALGQGLGVPVVGASTLEALALGIAEALGPDREDALVAPLIDARRSEVFAAAYRAGPPGSGRLEELMAPAALTPEALAVALGALARELGALWLAGDGLMAPGAAAALADPLLRPLGAASPAHRPRALDLVRRVEAGGARPALPLYLRLPDAEVNRRLRAGAGGPSDAGAAFGAPAGVAA